MKIVFRILALLTVFLSIFTVSCDGKCTHANLITTVTQPSCTEAGKTNYTCQDCGLSYIDNVTPAKSHTYTLNIIEPSCEKGGYTEYTCKCGYSYVSDHTDALGHEYTFRNDLPDCDDLGMTTYVCNRCKFTYVSDYVEPNGHKLVSTAIVPGCNTEGYTEHSCEICDYSYKTDFVKPTGHVFEVDTINEGSCTEIGIIKYTCSCGESYTENIYPQGHSFSQAVVMPTLSDMGYTEYACDECDFSYVGDYRFYSSIVGDAFADNNEVLANGIDISVYNHTANSDGSFKPLDWAAIKAEGIDYVILKAGSTLRENGTLGGIDTTFEMDYSDAKAAEIDVGVYFYTYATSVDQIKTDAYMLVAMLDGKQFEYPIYLDLEDDSIRDLGAEKLNEMCVEFFTILQSAGYYTGLYVNNEWLYNVIDTETAISKFDIWYARYPLTENPVWDVISEGMPFGMWQYTDSGSLLSIPECKVDKNYTYIDYPSIIVNGGFNGYESNMKFQDDGKEFVWIKANSLTVRSDSNFDSSENIIGYTGYGDRFEVIEFSEEYTKINYNGREAYISANSNYISLTPIWNKIQ